MPGDLPERVDSRVAQLGELLRVTFGSGLDVFAAADHTSPMADWWAAAGVSVNIGPVDPHEWCADRVGLYDLIVLLMPGGWRPWLSAIDRWQSQAVLAVDAFGLPGVDRPTDPDLFERRPDRAGVSTLAAARAAADRELTERADVLLAAHDRLAPSGADPVVVPLSVEPSTVPSTPRSRPVVMFGELHRGLHEPLESSARTVLEAVDPGEVTMSCGPATPPVLGSGVNVLPVSTWRTTLRQGEHLVLATSTGSGQEPALAAGLLAGCQVMATSLAAGFLAEVPALTIVDNESDIRLAVESTDDRSLDQPTEPGDLPGFVAVGDDVEPFVAALRSAGLAVSPLGAPRPAIDLGLTDPVVSDPAPVEFYRHRADLDHVPAAADFDHRPLISVVTPCYDTDRDHLVAAIESVRAQTYGRWELILVDDASPSPQVAEVADGFARRDPRIQFVALDDNRGIAGASDAAIERATGEFVAFLDHDDLLVPDALAWVVEAINARPDTDALYSDEAKIDEHGQWVDTFYKPAWSPELHLAYNYVTHLRVYRRSLLIDLDGHRSGFDGSQDYELALRVSEVTDRIVHIPRVLYGWRMIAGSAAAGVGEKPEAVARSERAITEALSRRGIDGHVETALDPHAHRVRYHHEHRPEVTIVIPTRDRAELMRTCIEAIEEITDPDDRRRYLIVDNESVEPETAALFAEFRRDLDVTIVSYPHEFSYARLMNLAMEHVGTELALMLNNDTTPVNRDWIGSMTELGMRRDVGAVGARLLFPSGAVQHEGINIGIGGCAANVCNNHYFSLGKLVRECSAVTAACVMVRPSVFWEVGGFDERLRVAFNDVDLTWRIHRSGRKVLYTPYTELVHAESASRGSLHPLDDEGFFNWRWGPWRDLIDPYYNPHLSRWHPYQLLVDDQRP